MENIFFKYRKYKKYHNSDVHCIMSTTSLVSNRDMFTRRIY